jgi:hypothetical protein
MLQFTVSEPSAIRLLLPAIISPVINNTFCTMVIHASNPVLYSFFISHMRQINSLAYL